MLRIAGVLVSCVLVVACQAPAASGASCARNADCVAPLACTYGRCRVQCATPRDCTVGLRCVATEGGLGVCTLPAEERCTPDVCAAPLTCIADQCRTMCTVDGDCQAGRCTSGSCVEPTEGVDAGVAVDGGGGDAGGQGVCDTTRWPADQTVLDMMFNDALPGPAGLRALAPAVVGPFATPFDDAATPAPLAGQIAVAAHENGGQGTGWVMWIEGPMRTLHAVEMPLDEPTAQQDLDLDGGAITGATSLDLGVSSTAFVGVVARPPPTTAGDPFAWVIDEDASSRVTAVDAPSAFGSDGVLGRAGVTGGHSPFGIGVDVQVRFVLGSGDFLRVLDRTLVAGAGLSTTYAAGFVEGGGSLGELYAFADPTGHGARVWYLHPGFDSGAATITTSTDGPPAIAALAVDPHIAFVAYPSARAVSIRRLDCTMGCPTSGTAVQTTAAPYAARRVALSSLGTGLVLAAVYSDGTPGGTLVALHSITAAGTPALIELPWSGPTLAANETIVDLRVAASPGALGLSSGWTASVIVAALIRDSSAMQDRVWIGGVAGCTP